MRDNTVVSAGNLVYQYVCPGLVFGGDSVLSAAVLESSRLLLRLIFKDPKASLRTRRLSEGPEG